MPAKLHVVRLSLEERAQLQTVISKGKTAAYKISNAHILLNTDVGDSGPGWKDQQIADAFKVSTRKVERLRKRLCTEGFDACLQKKPSGAPKRTFDGETEAQLIALVCSDAPKGRAQWTLRLLADKMVELKYLEKVSYNTVRDVLKKRLIIGGTAMRFARAFFRACFLRD